MALVCQLHLSVFPLQCDGAVCWTSQLGLQATLKQMLFFYYGIQAVWSSPHWVFFLHDRTPATSLSAGLR